MLPTSDRHTHVSSRSQASDPGSRGRQLFAAARRRRADRSRAAHRGDAGRTDDVDLRHHRGAQVIEALLLITLGIAIYGVYIGHGQETFYGTVIVLSVLFANFLFSAGRTHRIPIYRTVVQQNGRVLAAWSVVMVLLSFLAFMFKASTWSAGVARQLVCRRGGGAGPPSACRCGPSSGNGPPKPAASTHGDRRWRQGCRGAHRGHSAGADNDVNLIGLFDDRIDDRSPETVAAVRSSDRSRRWSSSPGAPASTW